MKWGWCKWQGSRDVWFCLILNHWLYFLFVSTEWFDPPQTLGVSNMAGKVSTWTSFVSSQLRLLWVNNIWRPQQPYMMVRMGNHTKNDLGMGIWTAFFFTTHQISLPKTAKWIDLFLSFLTISGKGLSNSQNKKRNQYPYTMVSESIDTRWTEQCSKPLYHRRLYYPLHGGLNVIRDEHPHEPVEWQRDFEHCSTHINWCGDGSKPCHTWGISLHSPAILRYHRYLYRVPGFWPITIWQCVKTLYPWWTPK